ncbi:choice-of-anchor Q domain-containing protein [cf. Phormidesmis sp. LEGE 11477]|uniref:choice-of-anchor Q domain-containing protein n=1 Tax=cf. Phormidesmis sp. LEGE 11477 TaxID=1828680 RepID=UPI0018816B81|nr:choice-of-anchor Q domain-containing protein [cf. Phormidesmis sp. LEGE 11477]MBE9064681.1 DUF4114 domain-containing protein [cf. Phormidesmis sp. LEGE 11477]
MSILFVDQNSVGGDGSAWNLAYQSLSSALESVQTGDQIWIAQGVYLPGSSRSDAFEIKAGVSIYGGFDGTEVNLSERDWQQHLTILSGDIGTAGEDSDNSYHVVVSDTNETAMLNGVIVEGGNTDGATGNDDGGGIYNRQSLTIENVIVRDNQSADDGGGIRNDGDLLIVNSAIANNSAIEGSSQFSGGGGLINTIGASATILNSTFSGNEALNGGAIRNDGTLSLVNTTISGNTGTQSSGGILNTISLDLMTPAIASLVGVTVTQNSAPSSAGISNVGSITVANSIIAGNQNDADFTDVSFGSSSNGNNIIGNGDAVAGFTNDFKNDQVGTSALPVNPLLGELQNNGGFTQTHLPGENSPAIDSGNNNLLPVDSEDSDSDNNRDETLPIDQRGVGFDRIFNNTVDIGAVEVGEEVVNEPPSAIAVQPIVVSLPENADTSSAIKLAEITVTDPDEVGINQLSLADLQSGDSDIFEIIDSQLFLRANTLLDFETQSFYTITLQVDDETVGNTPDASIDFDFLVTDVNDNEIGVLEPISNQLLNASISSGMEGQLDISVSETNTQQLSEVVVAIADEAGQVNGILPGETGYLDALVSESLSIFSTLEPGTFEGLEFARQIALEGNNFLQFGIITSGTLDSVRQGGAGTFQIGPSISEMLGGINSGILRAEALGGAKVKLGFDLGGGAGFGDLILTAQLQAADELLGAGLQGGLESELIDLRSVSGMVTADIMVYREAAFDNVVGFFTVENAEGQVRDQGGNLLSVGEAGYVTAAIQKRVTPDLTGENGSVKTYSTQIAGGQLLSSFIVSNGAIADLLDSGMTNDPDIYFTHIGANSDGADHVRLLGNNTFGFEDLSGGGDQDFDDLVIKASFSPVRL